MPSSTVTSKGQITIPVEVRRALKLEPGTRVDFLAQPNGSYELAPATSSISALKGIVKRPVRPVSLKVMDDAIAASIVERAQR